MKQWRDMSEGGKDDRIGNEEELKMRGFRVQVNDNRRGKERCDLGEERS